MVHRNAKLGLADRHALVSTVGGGMTLKQAVCRVQRDAGDSAPMVASLVGHERRGAETLSCLYDRSSRPPRSPRQLSAELAEVICACRRETGWGHGYDQPVQ